MIETAEKTGGVTKAGKVGNVIASAGQKFEDAFAGVKKSALVLRRQLEELRADEVEGTFGLIPAKLYGGRPELPDRFVSHCSPT